MIQNHKICFPGKGFMSSTDKLQAAAKYQCKFCIKSFTSKQWQDSHVNKFHMTDNENIVKHGEKMFGVFSDLQKHDMNNSNESKSHESSFLCEKCEKIFGSKSSLKRHLIFHTKSEEPQTQIKCDLCSKTFAFMSGFNRHKKLHSSKTLGRKIRCPYKKG